VTVPSLRRFADTMLTAVAPATAARIATDAFSRTRESPRRRSEVLPLRARTFSVPNQTGVTRGYLWGSGEAAAVLLHGWRADSGSMFSLVEPLRREGFTVAAFDAPGHGSSPGDVTTITDYAAAAEAVLTVLGQVRVVVAHSLGAIAAVAAMARTRAPVSGVVLVAPACALSGVLDRWRPAAIKLTRERVNGIYRELHRRNGTPVGHWDVRSLARDLMCPVLTIHDPEDPVVPFGDSEAIAAALPQTEILPVPGRGHYAILVAPEAKRAIARFVTGLGRVE
jgi:pimeloyl-ACP methyl ester carboxylesterase